MFVRPTDVHIDHCGAIMSVFSLHITQPMLFCLPAGMAVVGWIEGDCSSEDPNNSGNPNTHFMQIASTTHRGVLPSSNQEGRNPTPTLYSAIAYSAPYVSSQLNSHGLYPAGKLAMWKMLPCQRGVVYN